MCSVLAEYKLLSLCSPLCSSFVQLQKPATPVETIQSRARNSLYHQSRPWNRNSDKSGGREWSSEKGRQPGENGHSNDEFCRTLGFRDSESQPNRQNKGYLTWFTCGKKGHKSADCPEKSEQNYSRGGKSLIHRLSEQGEQEQERRAWSLLRGEVVA